MAGETWRQFWDKGEDYLRVAERGLERPDKFTPTALYNIASMAIEGHFMGRFVAAGGLPRNHTLADLVEYERETGSLPEDLAEELLAMDGFQSLCSLDAFARRDPDPRDLAGFVSLARRVRDLLATRLPAAVN